MICVGVGMAFILVILMGVDEEIASLETGSVLCSFVVWFGFIAFTLEFGTLVLKALRINYLFRKYQKTKLHVVIAVVLPMYIPAILQ